MGAQKQSPVFLPAKSRERFKNATVGWYPPHSDAYADGYFEAAELVATNALEGPFKNRLIFPVCYLYRHALEVVLKELIRKADQLIGLMNYFEDEDSSPREDLDDFLESTHSLQKLYEVLLGMLEITYPGSEVPSPVHAALVELHNRDTNGEAFRYARAKGTGKAVFEKQENFDIDRISARLGEAYRFLSWGIGGALSADIEMANDNLTETMRNANYAL
jgi:hypothetical protein